MSDDHDWVTRLLAATGPAAMPADVADRLDRVLLGAADPRLSTPSDASPTATQVQPPTTPDAAGAGTVPPVAGHVPPPTLPTSPGTATAGDQGTARPDVPDGAVPPPATAATTASLPRLRSVPAATGSALPDVSDDPDGDAPSGLGADTSAASSGPRTDGSRRALPEEGDEGRRIPARWLLAAAGVLVLAGAGVTVARVLDRPGDTSLTQASDAAGSTAVEAAAVPRSLLATGTQYTTADQAVFDAQVRDLVALAAGDPSGTVADEPGAAAAEAVDPEAAEPAPSAAAEDAPAVGSAPVDGAALPPASEARAAALDSPLADPQALSECVDQVSAGTTSTAAAVDLAVVDGVESTLIVVPDAAGLMYQVYVLGADCSGIDTQFKFYTVTP